MRIWSVIVAYTENAKYDKDIVINAIIIIITITIIVNDLYYCVPFTTIFKNITIVMQKTLKED